MIGRLFIITGVLLGGSQSAFAALNAQWKLQDNAASTTVVATVGTNGTLTGAGNTSASSSTPGPGTALARYLLFDGTSDYVNATTGNGAATNGASVVTLCCWVYVASADTTATHRLVYASTGVSAGATRVSVAMNASGQIVARARAGDAEGLQDKTSSSSYDDSAWHHVAVVFNYASDTTTIYIDGASVSSTGTISYTASAASTTDSLATRLASGDSADYFKGRMADCRIYDSDESANLAAIMDEADFSVVINPLSASIPGSGLDPLYRGPVQ